MIILLFNYLFTPLSSLFSASLFCLFSASLSCVSSSSTFSFSSSFFSTTVGQLKKSKSTNRSSLFIICHIIPRCKYCWEITKFTNKTCLILIHGNYFAKLNEYIIIIKNIWRNTKSQIPIMFNLTISNSSDKPPSYSFTRPMMVVFYTVRPFE